MNYVNQNNFIKKFPKVSNRITVNRSLPENSKISSCCEVTLPKIETLEHFACHINDRPFNFETPYENPTSRVDSSQKVMYHPTFKSFFSEVGYSQKQPSMKTPSIVYKNKVGLRSKILTNEIISDGQNYIVDHARAPEIGVIDYKIKKHVAKAKVHNDDNYQKKILSINDSDELASEEKEKEKEVDGEVSKEEEENENNEVFIKKVYDKIHEPTKKKKHTDPLGILFAQNTQSQKITDPNLEFAYEKDIKISNNIEMERIKKDIREIRRSQFKDQFEYLNELHKKAQKKAFASSIKYQEEKAVLSQLKSKNELKRHDYALLSKLYLISKSPLLQINKNITFPFMIHDSKVLADIFKVNMCNLKGFSEH